MKLKTLTFFSVVFFQTLVKTNNFNLLSIKNTEKEIVKQDIAKNSDFFSFDNYPEILIHFFRQPKYTKSSYKCFLRHTYNHPHYAQKFLAVNFSHVNSFLSYSNKTNLPRSYIDAVISLFHQKFKSTYYVNAYAFLDFLNEFPNQISKFLNEKTEKEEKIKNIKNSIYNFLLKDFEKLKENPEKSLNEISEKIYNITLAKPDNKDVDISISKLQNTIMLFLETVITKLIWNPKDQNEIWESIKKISHQLEELLIQNIIPDIESLDGLYWTLINRFCYFLEISGTEIALNCYKIINNELTTQRSSLWTIPEREPFIRSKLNHLRQHLLNAEVKARAYQEGIITNMTTP